MKRVQFCTFWFSDKLWWMIIFLNLTRLLPDLDMKLNSQPINVFRKLNSKILKFITFRMIFTAANYFWTINIILTIPRTHLLYHTQYIYVHVHTAQSSTNDWNNNDIRHIQRANWHTRAHTCYHMNCESGILCIFVFSFIETEYRSYTYILVSGL